MILALLRAPGVWVRNRRRRRALLLLQANGCTAIYSALRDDLVLEKYF
jgi:hypothetical protein